MEQKDDRVEWNAFLNVNTNFNSPRLSESIRENTIKFDIINFAKYLVSTRLQQQCIELLEFSFDMIMNHNNMSYPILVELVLIYNMWSRSNINDTAGCT